VPEGAVDSVGVALRAQIAACGVKIARYKGALDAGADPAVVAGWITATQAERAAATLALAHTAEDRWVTCGEPRIWCASTVVTATSSPGSSPARLALLREQRGGHRYLELGIPLSSHSLASACEDAQMSPRAVDPGRLAQWCVEHLGSPPADELFRSGHLSTVVGLRLADDREVVVKVRPDSPRIAGLRRSPALPVPGRLSVPRAADRRRRFRRRRGNRGGLRPRRCDAAERGPRGAGLR
jgi:hypothetical protein